MSASASSLIDWKLSPGLTPYPETVAEMERLADGIHQGTAPETIWLLEHPPLYTAGVSAKQSDLLAPARFPVHQTGRGGQYTYHGLGQRVVYVMLDLRRRGQDVRRFVQTLEEWIIVALAELGVEGFLREGRVGVWVDTPRGEEKIAALGIRVRRWVTFHGLAINVHPDLSHFQAIVPCGLENFGVTSLAALGVKADMAAVDAALRRTFPWREIAGNE